MYMLLKYLTFARVKLYLATRDFRFISPFRGARYHNKLFIDCHWFSITYETFHYGEYTGCLLSLVWHFFLSRAFIARSFFCREPTCCKRQKMGDLQSRFQSSKQHRSDALECIFCGTLANIKRAAGQKIVLFLSFLISAISRAVKHSPKWNINVQLLLRKTFVSSVVNDTPFGLAKYNILELKMTVDYMIVFIRMLQYKRIIKFWNYKNRISYDF